jgi:purine-nucleoside phosphorylase
MSIHINALPGEIAPVVLLAGDPLRAKFIADTYLENATRVSEIRNIYFYTGTYKGARISIGASGMGCASIGIYSFELYTEYQVDCIIRLGTCGAYSTNSKVLDLINVSAAVSESSYAKYAWGIEDEKILAQGNAISAISEMSKTLQYPLITTAVHSSDIFYRKDADIPAIAAKFKCPVVEMESFALYANAQYLQKNAACLLTVSDIIPTHEKISPDAREKSLLPMINLALKSAIHIAQLKA